MKVTLPNGQWANLRDKITNGQRKRFLLATRAHIKKDPSAYEEMELWLSASDAQIALLVDEWSVGVPVPELDAASLDALDSDVYDTLGKECLEHMKSLFPEFGVTPDPETPTEPSSA
jgi:hypothetical protein